VNWTAADSGLTNMYIRSLAVCGGTLYAGTAGGVFISANNGANWTAAGSGLTGIEVKSFVVNGGDVFALTDSGTVFLNVNNGSDWTAVDSGLPNFFVSSLAIGGGNLFAGTNGHGVWRRRLSEMIGPANARSQRKKMSQARFAIKPLDGAGAAVVIEFSLPHPDRVGITMHDLAGREMLSFVKGYLNAGSYRYIGDTRPFARGCYAVRLRAGADACTKLVQIVH
jgi:hypothetical protein